MSHCKTCIHSRLNNADRSWCKYSPKRNSIPGDCQAGIYNRYESIYTIEQPIVTGSRFYTPAKDDEQIVIAPVVLSIEEEE